MVRSIPPVVDHLPTDLHPHREEPAVNLLESIEATTAAMPWLTDADRAAVDLAKSYAETIDRLVATGEPDLLGKAAYLGPHLLGVLSALGGTPKGRKELDLKEEARGKLAEIRDLRSRQAPTKKRTVRSA